MLPGRPAAPSPACRLSCCLIWAALFRVNPGQRDRLDCLCLCVHVLRFVLLALTVGAAFSGVRAIAETG